MVRKFLSALVVATTVTVVPFAYAQETAAPQDAPSASASSDCAAKAAEKKLKGVALKSFTKKCERDAAKSTCDASANEKNLHGAARTSFTKKCVKEAVGH
jgi:psiF repeat